ncbi:hypothetical protein [Paenibacillus rigui]|uniref:GAF domain-containing protein n=1 Tax=Paenibacillus rigui TaxID=554312 RepID=A0A229UKW1_9BACL|nr:hypothetical protein [Paenibacillus rigui]OXM84011.1 hypothetical protein CF651_22430 [Paenibacillus rigui]
MEQIRKEEALAVRLDRFKLDTRSDFAGLALPLDSEGGQLQWSFVAGNTNRRYERMRVKRGRGLAGMAWQIGRLLTWDASMEETAVKAPEKRSLYLDCPLLLAEGLKAAAAVPVRSGGVGNDWLLLVGRRTPEAYSVTEIAYVQACAAELRDLI